MNPVSINYAKNCEEEDGLAYGEGRLHCRLMERVGIMAIRLSIHSPSPPLDVSVGQEFSYKKAAQALSLGSMNTVKKYVGYLSDTYLEAFATA